MSSTGDIGPGAGTGTGGGATASTAAETASPSATGGLSKWPPDDTLDPHSKDKPRGAMNQGSSNTKRPGTPRSVTGPPKWSLSNLGHHTAHTANPNQAAPTAAEQGPSGHPLTTSTSVSGISNRPEHSNQPGHVNLL